MTNSVLTTTSNQIVAFERKKKITVSIVEEYFLTRTLFKHILTNDKNDEFEILGDFSNLNECTNAINKDCMPDIIMMNFSFLDRRNIGKIRNLRIKYPDVKLLIITTHQDINEIINCLELGVLGYILKSADKETIKEGIRQVSADKIFVDPSIIEDKKIKIAG